MQDEVCLHFQPHRTTYGVHPGGELEFEMDTRTDGGSMEHRDRPWLSVWTNAEVLPDTPWLAHASSNVTITHSMA